MKPMRLEYKFLVKNSLLDDLRQALMPYIYFDEYSEAGTGKEYTVRSIYFDSVKLEDYFDKLAGIKVRKKLRIRGYNKKDENSLVFAEIKRKHDNFVSKNRAPLYFRDVEEFLVTSNYNDLILKKANFIDALGDAKKFVYLKTIKNCSPIVLVTYDREAFYSKFDSTLRITFDKNVRSKPLPGIGNLYDDDLKLAMPGYFVLETKFFGGYPTWLQKIVRQFDLSRQSISKYTTCVDNHFQLKKFVNNKISLFNITPSYNHNIILKDVLKYAG